MNKWLRRIRGAIGLGLTWAFAWFGAGMALLLVGVEADVPFPIGFGMIGFFAGVSFSGVLGLVEGRRRFDQMSIPRFAGWGAVGGLLLAGGFVSAVAIIDGSILPIFVLGPVFALAGAGSAAGTLALARMGEDRELLDVSAEVDAVGLSADEARELLGGGG